MSITYIGQLFALDWVHDQVTFYRKLAEIAGEYLKKGRHGG